MDKNSFLIINDIIYSLYACPTFEDLRKRFLARLKMLIPFSYSSIMIADGSQQDIVRLASPICYPDYFVDAEMEYMKRPEQDLLLWMLHSKESILVKESDMIDEDKRLNSALYLTCYKKYNVYDSIQFSIVYQQELLGVLSLFRTKIDGAFTDDDLFFLRSLGIHLNSVFHRLITEKDKPPFDTEKLVESLALQYHLTPREAQILSMIFVYRSNAEIVQELNICENTIQKHMQNLFRKMNVSSKWELLRFLL